MHAWHAAVQSLRCTYRPPVQSNPTTNRKTVNDGVTFEISSDLARPQLPHTVTGFGKSYYSQAN